MRADIYPLQVLTLPAAAPKVGLWHEPESMETDILAGRTYVNIHSLMFPSGELRGQIQITDQRTAPP